MNKFLLFLITFSTLIFVSVATINIYFESTLFNDFFNKKIHILTEDRRKISPVIIRHFKPKCILVGTSRIGRGISAENEYIQKNKCFNLYLNAANIDEINLLLNKSIKNEVEQIIFGLDFFSFNSNYTIERYQGNLNKYEYLSDNFILILLSNFNKIISLRNLKNNLYDFFKNKKLSYDKLQDYKTMFSNTYDVTINNRFDFTLIDDRYSKSQSVFKYISKNEKGHGIGDFKLNEKGLNNLLKIVKKINNSEIKLKIFITPVHLYLMEAIYRSGLDNEYFKIIEEISKVTNDINSKIYDFSGYNEITSGLDINKKFVNGYYIDLDHYSSAVGDKILKNLFKQDYNFGEKITKINFSEYKKNKLKERARWLSKNEIDRNILEKIFECKKLKCIDRIIFKSFDLKNIKIKNNFNSDLENEIFINGGEYIYGYKPHLRTKFGDNLNKITVGSFLIDRTELSYSQFNIKYQSTNLKNLPVVNISYNEAENFCKSIGKDLPTKFQWEVAARGNNLIRYSWGNEFPTCDLATFNGELSYGCSGNKEANSDGTYTKAVNSNKKGASNEGVLNLIGNVYEFVKSNDEGIALAKGGGWSSELNRINIAHNYYVSKDIGYKNIGFRCVKNIE